MGAEADVRLTLRRDDGGSVSDVKILDQSLREIQQTDGDATTAAFTAGRDYVLVFPAADTAATYAVTADAGPESLSTDVATNLLAPTDTDGDGDTTPIDALAVLNTLRRVSTGGDDADGETTPAPWMDVNADGRVSPLDALAVLNHLRRRSTAGGESASDSSFMTRRTMAIIEEPWRTSPMVSLSKWT